MENTRKTLALERMEILAFNARLNVVSDPHLAQRHAKAIRTLSMRYKIRLPKNIRALFCKRCKSFIVPGISSRTRVGRAHTRSIRTTCLFCNHTHRQILAL